MQVWQMKYIFKENLQEKKYKSYTKISIKQIL